MKKTIKITIVLFMLSVIPVLSRAQSIAQDLQQLALDYQKLSGLRKILTQMYTGYEVLSKGYNAVKDVSQGDFTLHEAFLDGLMIASPTVRQYPKVQAIIDGQMELMSEYSMAWNSFKQDKHFNPDEVGYMMDVYNNLISQSLKNLSDLTMVLANGSLRMSDAERLAAIDRIFAGSGAQLSFLRSFNDRNYMIAAQRAEADASRSTIQTLYGNQ